MAKIFLTGGSGFIGSWIARYLYKHGHLLTLLLRESSRLDLLEGIEFERITGDLSQSISFSGSIDYIIHAGALVRSHLSWDYYRINTYGTKNVIDLARRLSVKGFLLLSSIAASGPDGLGHPVSHYGRSKLLAEELVKRSGLSHTIIRLPVVYGPGDREGSRMFELLKRGVGLLPGGDHRLSLIYVEDVADFILKIIEERRFRGETINLSDGKIYHLSDILRIAGFLMEKKPIMLTLSPGFLSLIVPFLDILFKNHSPISRDKVRELLHPGWAFMESYKINPRFDIEAGLRETVGSLRE